MHSSSSALCCFSNSSQLFTSTSFIFVAHISYYLALDNVYSLQAHFSIIHFKTVENNKPTTIILVNVKRRFILALRLQNTGLNVCNWYIPGPHTIKLLAVKQPVATGCSWPIFACHATLFTVNSTSASGLMSDF